MRCRITMAFVLLAGCSSNPYDETAAIKEACSTVVAPMVDNRQKLDEALGDRNQYGIADARAKMCVEHAAYIGAVNLNVTPEAVLAQCAADVKALLAAEVYRMNTPQPSVKVFTDKQSADTIMMILHGEADLTLNLTRQSKCWKIQKQSGEV